MGKLFDRAIKLLKSPKTEWPVIAGEPQPWARCTFHMCWFSQPSDR